MTPLNNGVFFMATRKVGTELKKARLKQRAAVLDAEEKAKAAKEKLAEEKLKLKNMPVK